jgi:hypothetical protein
MPGHELLHGNADMRAVHEPDLSRHPSELLRDTGHGNAILYSLRPHLHSALLTILLSWGMTSPGKSYDHTKLYRGGFRPLSGAA